MNKDTEKTEVQITEERVREIVREEIERGRNETLTLMGGVRPVRNRPRNIEGSDSYST